jgi:hypothetical protein
MGRFRTILNVPVILALTCAAALAEKDGNNFILELPSGATRGQGEWSVTTGARTRLFLEDLGLDEKEWPRISAMDLIVIPSAGVFLSPGQISLEVQPLHLVVVSPLYRKDLLGGRNQYVGAQFYFMMVFSWLVLPEYLVYERSRMVRTLEPQYTVRWNIEEKYRIHEFGIVMGFWFPGIHAEK